MPPFPCTRCGACCLDLSMVPEMQDFMLPSGKCSKLGADNKTCTIYAERPLLCQVDNLGKFLRLGPSWTALMGVACQELHQKAYGVPQEPLGEECQHVL